MASVILDYMDIIQKRMPCGFPQLGLPPLAPLIINNQSIDFDYETSYIRGSIDQFRLDGLNDFDFPELHLNLMASELVFRVRFDGLHLRTKYNVTMKLQEDELKVRVMGEGPAEVHLEGLEFWGTVKFAVNIFKGKIRVKSVDLQSHIDKVDTNIKGLLGEANDILNDLLPKAIQVITNGQENNVISTIVEMAGLPMINQMLEGFTLDDLMNLMPEEGDYDDECSNSTF